MKTVAEISQILQAQKPLLSQKYGIKAVGIFGSYRRGEQTENSDLDILVDLEKPIHIDLLDFIQMENYLSDLFKIKVDVVIKENLKRRIGQRILQEVVML